MSIPNLRHIGLAGTLSHVQRQPVLTIRNSVCNTHGYNGLRIKTLSLVKQDGILKSSREGRVVSYRMSSPYAHQGYWYIIGKKAGS
jgi:hypothetical protein